ncbi:STAS domain-containing protein [Vibrio tubiashii]|jgi:anti-anti-sigma factor|uniref:Anti-anti-sigma regulatory factor n=2 Tax=Vibrio tubiashii TaxID=29498 RepID=F9T979_9VIBR|nr:STAS domain-containing protein [Vibrio tubiashii]AIW15510.1 anti-anti-sigma regulatory factor [Vibrio tubiashii ATCC 19109]EGU51527.1 anti-anti-sigma regulatory factor (antagonist of anti-sigma factor) [Vibrio tubiashii ATCC 19109]EIF03698.1 anti-anti-sigma regulatory factor (antagonist of anti-sigma factor) [Vibrio tubiashii NCIMB 1337 = ATCC 19106]MCG9576963.1 STAS domain-containing protein [Vibrio tubiashii]MCG9579964.1 STAS domain-containing protein [Vibrio tubiashii]
MSVETVIDSATKHVTILIEGAFGFNLVQEFRRCYNDRQEFRFTIDLRKVDYIDSAGLGMLLNMHNYLGQEDGMIRITNTLPQVRKILTISRFDKKFAIE